MGRLKPAWAGGYLPASILLLVWSCGSNPLTEPYCREERAGFSWAMLSASNTCLRLSDLRWGEQGSSLRPEVLRGLAQVRLQIDQDLEKGPDFEVLHEAGVYRLLLGEWDEAVGMLEESLSLHGGPDVRADLAAAYLARGKASGQLLDLVRAASLADREGQDLSPQLRVNHALALASLGLRREAAGWLDGALSLDLPKSWEQRSKALLSDLRSPSAEQRWTEIQIALERQVDNGAWPDIAPFVRQFPLRSRQFGETVLGRWATAYRSGDVSRAAAWLDLARRIGLAQASERNEELLLEAATAVETALGRGGVPLEDLVEAHIRYQKAIEKYQDRDTLAALSLFESARPGFDNVQSPFSLRAQFYSSLCRYFSDASVGLSGLRQLSASVSPTRHPALLGRIYWVMGSASKTLRRFDDALDYYQRAQKLLEKSSGPAQSAFLMTLRAETLHQIGDADNSWRLRMKALPQVVCFARPLRILAALQEAVAALTDAGADRVAILVLEEIDRLATQTGSPFWMANAHLHQALALNRLELPAREL